MSNNERFSIDLFENIRFFDALLVLPVLEGIQDKGLRSENGYSLGGRICKPAQIIH